MGNPPSVPEPSPPSGTPAPVTPSPTCQLEQANVPQLKVTVAPVDGAGTGNDVFGRILFGSSPIAAQWSEWQLLEHTNCVNLDVSATDYFNQFQDITDPWLAVAVYNCGDDDVVIDTIGVWDGSASKDIDYFCSNIAGPSHQCGVDSTNGAVGSCNNLDDTLFPYDYMTLDQDTCSALFFKTDAFTTRDVPVAAAITAFDPGAPDCTLPTSYSAARNRNKLIRSHTYEQRFTAIDAASIAILDTPSSINPVMDDNLRLLAFPLGFLATGGLAYLWFKRPCSKLIRDKGCTGDSDGADEDDEVQPFLYQSIE